MKKKMRFMFYYNRLATNNHLYRKIKAVFVNLAENLCLDWINALRTKVGEDAIENVYTVNEEKD